MTVTTEPIPSEYYRLVEELQMNFKDHATTDESFQVWAREELIERKARGEEMLEILKQLQKKVTPLDDTYQRVGWLWHVVLGAISFFGLIGSAVIALPAIWHLLFPPKI